MCSLLQKKVFALRARVCLAPVMRRKVVRKMGGRGGGHSRGTFKGRGASGGRGASRGRGTSRAQGTTCKLKEGAGSYPRGVARARTQRGDGASRRCPRSGSSASRRGNRGCSTSTASSSRARDLDTGLSPYSASQPALASCHLESQSSTSSTSIFCPHPLNLRISILVSASD